jgi:hypothetical protein
MNLSPTLLLYRTGFAPTNGTSVQLERLLRGNGDKIIHVMWDSREGGNESVEWVVDTTVDSARRTKLRGRIGRGYELFRSIAATSLWRMRWIYPTRLTDAIKSIPLRPIQAYISCYGEREAGHAYTLWEKLGRPPFAFHIFDIFDAPLSREKTPNFLKLTQIASHVICLNRLIELEVIRVGATETSILPLCSDLMCAPRKYPGPGLKILISGTLYRDDKKKNSALHLLIDAWSELERAHPRLELHYCGRSSWAIPEELKRRTHDHGLLSWEAYLKLMHSCHVAFVPVAHQARTRLQFSIPSRIPDYLASGLPVIASTVPNTAAHDFFETAPRECTRGVASANELVSAFQQLSGACGRWEAASLAALEYSVQRFAIKPARNRLIELLNRAGTGTKGSQ